MACQQSAQVYIVFGSSGEYEDYSRWPVRAFLSEQDANDYKQAAEGWRDAHAPRWKAAREWVAAGGPRDAKVLGAAVRALARLDAAKKP